MPATPTYVLLNQITLAAASSSVTLSNIPQNYGDLVLVLQGTASTSAGLPMRFNGDTGSNYANVVAYGTGSGTSAEASSGTTSLEIGYFTTNPAMCAAQFMDYSAIDKHKTVLIRYGSSAASNIAAMRAGRWASTAALTSVTLSTTTGTYSSGTTFYLYGLVA